MLPSHQAPPHRNRSEVDKIQGADNASLEAKIKELYESEGWDGETQSGVKGMIELNALLDHSATECLNQDDDHPYTDCLVTGAAVCMQGGQGNTWKYLEIPGIL